MNITNAQRWFKEWGFLAIVTLLCLAAAFTYIVDQESVERCIHQAQSPIQTTDNSATEQAATETGAQTSATPRLKPFGEETGTVKSAVTNTSAETISDTPSDFRRALFKLFFLLAAGASLTWFVFAFTGDPAERCYEGVKFAYFFVIGSFAILAIPPLIKSQAIGHEPIGIISGCVKDVNAPDGLRCISSTKKKENKSRDDLIENNLENSATPSITSAKYEAEEKNQWLINIGGSLTPQSARPQNQCGEPCKNKDSECEIGSMNNRAYITGGLIVPLPFVIIALFGGAVSLSRRVPEIQKCANPKYVGTATEPMLSHGEARERLAFQIMQYISAPLIAVVAYHVIQPESNATSAALAFMSGFGSETILMMIRGVVNGIQPRNITVAASTGETAAATKAASSSVLVSLVIASDTFDPGSLSLTVDKTPVGIPADGLIKLPLEVGRTHHIVVSGTHGSKNVRGELELTPTPEDKDKAITLKLT